MANKQGVTAGELANKALSDNSRYDPRDLSYAWTKDIISEVWKCIDIHKDKCLDNEFFVVMVYADDCLIKNVIRRKFYAWPFLPKPRPRQSVWLYRKDADDIQFLWSLPTPEAMAVLGTYINVPKQYKRMQAWTRAFFDGKFPEYIRKENDISFLTEGEFLKSQAREGVKPIPDDGSSGFSDTFDFFKPFKSKVVDSDDALTQ